MEDPGVFEVRINRYNEVVVDTFEGRKIIQNDSITGAFIDNLTAALTSANNVSRQMITMTWCYRTVPGNYLFTACGDR